jgi:tRNA dimethylallyltransferase
MLNANIPLITILGPTGSGKTALAVELAQDVSGEIVCADSRTVYRGLDIGTAKPTLQEQAAVPHHLLNLIDPGEAAFKRLAEAYITDIWQRGNIPFLVGGSGLYIDAVLFDYQFGSMPDAQARARLEALTTPELQELLAAADPEAFEQVDLANRRRVIRAIEMAGQQASRLSAVRPRTLVLGLVMNKEVIQSRIEQRVEKMLSSGLIHEVTQLAQTYGWDSPVMNIAGYAVFKEAILGTKPLAEAAAEFARGHIQLVKKQQTWFKRNPDIVWLDDPAQAGSLVREFLSKL